MPDITEAGFGVSDSAGTKLYLKYALLCPIVTINTPAMPLNDAHFGGFFCARINRAHRCLSDPASAEITQLLQEVHV